MKPFKYAPKHTETVQDKRTHYTVTPISNIESWRKEQAIRESEWHTEKEARFARARASAMAIVSEDKKKDLLSALDKLEIEYEHSRASAQKLSPITWEQIKAKMDNWDAKNSEVARKHRFIKEDVPKSQVSVTTKIFAVLRKLF